MRRRNTFAYRSLLYWATVSLEMWTVDKCTNRKRVCVVNSTNIAARNSLRLGANVPAIAAKRHTRKWMEHGGSQLTERRRGGRLRRFLVAMATPFSAKKNRKNLQPQTERSLAFSLSVLLEPRSTLVWLALCCFSLFCFLIPSRSVYFVCCCGLWNTISSILVIVYSWQTWIAIWTWINSISPTVVVVVALWTCRFRLSHWKWYNSANKIFQKEIQRKGKPMRLTRNTASGWLIRLVLTAALLLWEYAAANGTNKNKISPLYLHMHYAY